MNSTVCQLYDFGDSPLMLIGLGLQKQLNNLCMASPRGYPNHPPFGGLLLVRLSLQVHRDEGGEDQKTNRIKKTYPTTNKMRIKKAMAAL